MSTKSKGVRTRGWWQENHSQEELKDALWWDRVEEFEDEEQFDVFAIEGLVDAPGLDEQSTRDLMSQIEKYAHQEEKIVVVSKRAYIRDGVDLSAYYVGHGFEKVEMEKGWSGSAEDGVAWPVLIYSERWFHGPSAEDVPVDPQVMVGLNLWTGI